MAAANPGRGTIRRPRLTTRAPVALLHWMKRVLKAGMWPVRCAPIGSVAVGSVLWRHDGQLLCTVVVKVTFGLEPGGPMKRINPSPLRRSDDYIHGVPSLAGASEIAPRMDQVDVTVVGKAYNKRPGDKRAIRFVLVRGQQVLIDKTLYVYGNRSKGTAPKPFTVMRIGYERALGGLDFPRNPIGVGADRDSTRRPNVVHPKGPKKKVAGYGPIPSRFLLRRQLRGDVKLERMVDGIVDYPDDFDWSYFQAAPRDQRLPRLKGDEWLMLEGMHQEHERIRARLPRVRGLCRIYSQKDVGAPTTVDLNATMLHVEPEDDRCSMVFRGSFPVVSELASEQLVIAGAVQCGDEPVRWPSSMQDLEKMASPAAPVSQIDGAVADDFQRTVVSPGAREHAPERNLGLGYRLGDQRIQLSAAEPAGPQELPPGQALESAAAQRRHIVPPPLPPSNVPPPPSFAGHDSGAYPVVATPYPAVQSAGGPPPPPRRRPPFPPAPSATAPSVAGAPGVPFPPAPSANVAPPTQAPATQVPYTQAPSTQVPYTQVPHTQAPYTQAPYTQVPSTHTPGTAPGGWGPHQPVASAPATQVPMKAPMGTPQAAADQAADFSSTDEMEDPDGDAAADAGLAPHVSAQTRNVAIQAFDSTVQIAEPEAEAVADMDEHPLAFTQVNVEVDEEES
jgi:hypothetical protein